jgi:hypothetical protein
MWIQTVVLGPAQGHADELAQCATTEGFVTAVEGLVASENISFGGIPAFFIPNSPIISCVLHFTMPIILDII